MPSSYVSSGIGTLEKQLEDWPREPTLEAPQRLASGFAFGTFVG